MRKYINLILSVSVVLLSAACAKEINGPAENAETYSAVITASVDGADTKTVLNFDGRKSYWFGEENISVLGAEGKGYKFSANLAEKSLTADFGYTGDEEFAETEVLAVYPEAIYEWNLEEKTVNAVTIPATQYPTKETFAGNAVPAIAYSENVSDGLQFRNIPALIMFTTSEANGYRVTFRGKNGEKVAGSFDVTYGDVLSVAPTDDNDVTSVTLGDLTMENGKPYFLAVAPQNYSEGFVVELNGTVVYEYEGSKTLESNKIYNIGEINIPVMEQWYLCGSMTDEWQDQVEMIKGDDGWYVAEDITIFTGDDSFKFKQGEPGKWPKEFGSSVENKKYAKDVEFAVVNSKAKNIYVAENGIYDVMFNPETAKAKLVYNGPITAPIRIYADNQLEWNTLNVHLWEEKGDENADIKIAGEWPGAAMTKDPTTGLWYYDIDVQHHGKYIGYLFNNGSDKLIERYTTLTKNGFTAEVKDVYGLVVKVNKDIDWYDKYIYAYYGNPVTEMNGSWPGSKLDWVKEDGDYYVYKYEYDASQSELTVNYIINKGEGGTGNETNPLEVTLRKNQEVTVTVESTDVQ